jgi:hypothetical protein
VLGQCIPLFEHGVTYTLKFSTGHFTVKGS